MKCKAQKAVEQFQQSMSWNDVSNYTRRAAQILLKGERGIFEVIDVTNDEIYISLGIYENLEDACEMATEGDVPPVEDIGETEEHCTIQVRYRPLNQWSVNQSTMATFEWKEDYNVDLDKSVWQWSEI